MKYGGFKEFDGELEPWPVRLCIISRKEILMLKRQHPKRRWRAIMHASGWRCRCANRRSARAIGRPIRNAKRRKEKARRYCLTSGAQDKWLNFLKKRMEEKHE